jgi:hypothetical protein
MPDVPGCSCLIFASICVHRDQQFTVCPGENGNGCQQMSEQYECSHYGGNGYHSLTLGRELNSFCTGKSISQKARQRAWNQDQAAKFMFLGTELLFGYEMVRDQVIKGKIWGQIDGDAGSKSPGRS